MKVVINLSVMLSGVVVVDFASNNDGTATVVSEDDHAWTATQVGREEGDDPAQISAAHSDQDLRNVAVLRILARAHERWQELVEKSVQVTTLPEVPKGEAN